MSRDRITVSTHGLEDIAADFMGAPEQIDAAGKRALRKTVNWLSSRVRKGIAAELGGADHRKLRKRIAGRVFTHTGEVFVGLGRLPAHLAGNVSQTAAGAQVGDRQFPGAFVAKIYTPEEKVWIRLHSKHYDAEIYPYKKRKFAGATPAELRHRFPVVLATVPMDTPGIHRVIDEHAALAHERLRTVYAQELRYATTVEGA